MQNKGVSIFLVLKSKEVKSEPLFQDLISSGIFILEQDNLACGKPRRKRKAQLCLTLVNPLATLIAWTCTTSRRNFGASESF